MFDNGIHIVVYRQSAQMKIYTLDLYSKMAVSPIWRKIIQISILAYQHSDAFTSKMEFEKFCMMHFYDLFLCENLQFGSKRLCGIRFGFYFVASKIIIR